jgi:hypothetical protein
MVEFKPGDRVRIKDRPDWPLPSGYKLAGVEGTIFELNDEIPGYSWVLLDKDVTGIDTKIPLGFRLDAIEKILL